MTYQKIMRRAAIDIFAKSEDGWQMDRLIDYMSCKIGCDPMDLDDCVTDIALAIDHALNGEPIWSAYRSAWWQ